MTRFSHAVSLLLALVGLAACGAPPAPAPSQAANSMSPRDRLSRIVDRYWDEHQLPGNPLTVQFMADSLAVERRFLADVLAVPRDRLDEDGKLTDDIFRRQRELDIEGFTYPNELLPVNPFEGVPLQLARAAADTEQHPFKTAKEYENWLLRIDDYPGWSRQAVINMREGMRRGYTMPRVLMTRMLPLLQGFGEDSSANVFYVPLRTMPESILESERTRLTSVLTGEIKDKLLPAYRELHDFIQNEYLPRARPSVALSALPLGPSWYAYRIKRATSTSLTPAEIHHIGVTEVERIRARMKLLSTGGSAGTAPPGTPSPGTPSPGTRSVGTPSAGTPGIAAAAVSAQPAAAASPPSAPASELMNSYQELKVRTVAAMPTLFSVMPTADFEIRESDPSSDPATFLDYQRASPDGTPAVLYVNTATENARPTRIQIAGFLREALPGRHYQSALQQERADLPKFRRFGAEPAFVEGWALYAASLGEDLGLYRDDEAKRDALLLQLKCAVALVVDTGLHAEGWTRAQAVDYLQAQLAADDAEANLMADRFIALPADALACKIGELRIQSLRNQAQQALGARFDIREFHSELLKDGSMPLDLIETKMKLWMQSGR
jgi:uncharacterized protein (DUF885 family)